MELSIRCRCRLEENYPVPLSLWDLASKDCGASLHLSIPAHLRALQGYDRKRHDTYLIKHDNSSFTPTNKSLSSSLSLSLSLTLPLSLSLGHRPPSQQPHHLPPTWGPLQKSQSTLPRPPLADLAVELPANQSTGVRTSSTPALRFPQLVSEHGNHRRDRSKKQWKQR